MAVRIRLQRHGTKKRPYYRIVAADQRAPRDGRFAELLGTYDPLHTPNVVDLDLERVDYWVGVGAQPSQTAASVIERFRAGKTITTAQLVEHNKGARQARREAALKAEPVKLEPPKAEAPAEATADEPASDNA